MRKIKGTHHMTPPLRNDFYKTSVRVKSSIVLFVRANSSAYCFGAIW